MKLTKQQSRALFAVYLRTTMDQSYRQFRRGVEPEIGGTAVMIQWSGILLGIERDGYTHS